MAFAEKEVNVTISLFASLSVNQFIQQEDKNRNTTLELISYEMLKLQFHFKAPHVITHHISKFPRTLFCACFASFLVSTMRRGNEVLPSREPTDIGICCCCCCPWTTIPASQPAAGLVVCDFHSTKYPSSVLYKTDGSVVLFSVLYRCPKRKELIRQ